MNIIDIGNDRATEVRPVPWSDFRKEVMGHYELPLVVKQTRRAMLRMFDALEALEPPPATPPGDWGADFGQRRPRGSPTAGLRPTRRPPRRSASFGPRGCNATSWP